MALPIFWRIILSSLAILLFSAGVSSYSIVQLGTLSRHASTVLNKDNRVILYEEKLSDVFLSEVRYAGKFIITRAKAHYDQARQFKTDFDRYMDEIKKLDVSPDIRARLARVEELHDRYGHLYDQEVRYVKTGQLYAESRYKQEREKILDSTLRELENLKAQLQNNLHVKLQSMEKAGRTARGIAAATTLILLALGVALSFGISKSITAPLLELTHRMEQDGEENQSSVSASARIPEIQELSEAVRKAKNKLRQAADTNAGFVDSITEEFAMPLVSLKKRLGYLQNELTQVITAEQKTVFDILANETEHLIQHCAALNLPPGVVEAGRRNQQAQTAVDRTASSTEKLSSISYGSRLFHRPELSFASFTALGARLASISTHSIGESLRTIRYRKARKQ